MIAEMGHIFGWEDIYHQRNYTTNLKCYSKSGILLKIKANDFLDFIMKDESTYKLFINLSHTRD